MYKLLSIVGARPNFIKLAPVDKALSGSGTFEHIILHTGQHYDANLSEDLFSELQLPQPNYNLGIGSGRQAWQLGKMICGIDEVLQKEKPDAVLVYGDTNSTAAGAIAAAKNVVPLAHVEAGLREFDKRIPEEVNKLLTTSVTDLYFCPTPTGVKNLKSIGIEKNVHLVGDVGIDLIFNHLDRINDAEAILKKYGVEESSYYFVTCHRAKNTDTAGPLAEIISALEQLEHPVIFPIHPRTAKAIEQFSLPNPSSFPHVQVVPPLGFFETQTLIRFAKMAITDSGGVVKEAYFHKTPAIIIDLQIEWLETVEEGWNRIAGPNAELILQFASNWQRPTYHSNCLGDGKAALKIAEIVKNYLDGQP